MKNILFFLSLILFAASCGGGEAAMPTDLAGKQKMLQEKKSALSDLKNEIATLEAEVENLSPEKDKQKRLVTTQPVSRKDFRHFVELQGSIKSDDLVNVTCEVPGRIVNLAVVEGQNVRKGALIAKIDMEQLDKQKAELEKSLELAAEIFLRQERLWNQKIGSEIQFLQAKNNKERIEKSMESLSFQQTKSNVYAPISGVVEMVATKAGEFANPGFPIVQILNTNKVKVVVDAPESYLTAVKKGDNVNINFPALDKDISGRVALIGKTIDPSNRTFKVEVNLNNANGLYKPNLLALMSINDVTVKNTVVVPLSIIQQETGGESYVYVKTKGAEGDTATKIMVTTGDSFDGEIVITEGLDGTEELILDGARFVNDKELVEVRNAE